LSRITRRLKATESLLSPERACLTFSLAKLSARQDVETHLEPLWSGWIGRKVPLPLRPLRRLFTATRRLSQVRSGDAFIGFAQALVESDCDGDFVDVWSVPVGMVEPLVSHMREGGADPEDLLLTEPAAAGLQIAILHMDTGSQWAFTVRRGSICPSDVAAVFDAFGEDLDAEDAGGRPGGPTSGCS
jgi:hypothetical protein